MQQEQRIADDQDTMDTSTLLVDPADKDAASVTEVPAVASRAVYSGRDLEAAALLQAVGGNNIVTRPAEYPARTRLAICQGKACMKRGAAALLEVAQTEGGMGVRVEVATCKCLNKCKEGPTVSLRASGQKPVVLTGVSSEMLPSILGRSPVDAPINGILSNRVV